MKWLRRWRYRQHVKGCVVWVGSGWQEGWRCFICGKANVNNKTAGAAKLTRKEHIAIHLFQLAAWKVDSKHDKRDRKTITNT